VPDSFADSSWSARYAAMGDESESVFREVHDKPYIEWGLRRPPIKVSNLPLRVRCAPDFLTSDELIEAMGMGREGVLKLKIEKWLGLSLWAFEFPLRIFVWDSHRRRYGYLTFKQVTDFISSGVKLRRFPEGKAYYELPVAEMDIEWVTREP
jgi:hypothetical protein